jgi:hypothetical protein
MLAMHGNVYLRQGRIPETEEVLYRACQLGDPSATASLGIVYMK